MGTSDGSPDNNSENIIGNYNRMDTQYTVYLVDDNEINLQLLSSYVKAAYAGVQIHAFLSAEDFLQCLPVQRPGCLLLDNMMPGMSGLELQQKLGPELDGIPVIFMSGDSRYEDVFHATRNGAMAFLQKPISREKLLEKLQAAFSQSREFCSKQTDLQRDQQQFDSLSDREKEVFRLLAEGAPNKLIARKLGIALRTVEYHRANIFRKLDKSLVVDIIALARRLGL